MSKSKQAATETEPEARGGLGLIQKLALGVFGLGLVGSVAARYLLGVGEPEAAAGGKGSSLKKGLTADQSGEFEGKFIPGLEGLGQPAESAASTPEDLLPFFTEASFFGLIGFGLGYASRKIIKLLLVFAGLFFLGVQGLQQAGIVENVDWGKAIAGLNEFVFNLKENASISSWLTDRVPTAGALTAGYFVGLRRG